MDQMLALVPIQTDPVVLFDYKETTSNPPMHHYAPHPQFYQGLTVSAQCRTELFSFHDKV